jgi:ureidoglycolate lyase
MTRTIALPLLPATAEQLMPFGQILGSAAGVPPTPVDFYRGQVRMSHPVAFHCEHPVELTLATLSLRPPEVRYMERHFQHTQTFIPLGGKPFVAVMAPPCDGDLPDLEAVRAFRFDGSAGFALHLGTWHEFPFAIEEESEMVVILSTQTGYDLHAKDAVTQEASGPDLDKKDLVARTGTVFRFAMDR